MALAVVNVLVNVRKVTKKGSQSGEAFAIAKGVYGLFKKGAGVAGIDLPSLEEDQTAQMLKEIKEAIDRLTKQVKQFSQGLGLQVEAGEAYHKILNLVSDFSEDPRDKALIAAITDRSNGIHSHLSTLQRTLTKTTLLNPAQESWITYICKYCQDNSADDDFTWGFRPACEIFASMLALQRSAIGVLRKALEASGEPADKIDRTEKGHNKAIDEQVETFLKTFGEYWDKTMRKKDKIALRIDPYKSSNLESHNDELYWFEYNKKDTTLVKLDSSLRKTVLTRNSLSGGLLVSHNSKLYVFEFDTDQLIEIDPETGEKRNSFSQPEFKGTVFRSMVLSHQGYIYIIKGDHLYQIDPTHKRVERIGSGWKLASLAAVDGKHTIYARCPTIVYGVIYEIDPSKRGSSMYTRVSGVYEFDATENACIVGYGRHLYTPGVCNVWAFDTKDHSFSKIAEGRIFAFVHITDHIETRHSLSILTRNMRGISYCDDCVRILKPYWVHPPTDWYEQLLTKRTVST